MYVIIILIIIYGAPSHKSPEYLQRQYAHFISHTHARARTHTHTHIHPTHTHTYTHTHTHIHPPTHTHALLVMGWYNEKKTTDQYAEGKRWVFS